MAFMRDAKNLNWAFVCADNLAASTGTVTEAGDILDGQVVVLNADNVIQTSALSAGAQFKLAQRNGNDLIVSPLFTFKSATHANYAAAAQQVTTIGSNGTTAVLLDPAFTDTTTAAAAVGNSYYVLIEKNDNDEATRTGYRADITAQVKLTDPNSHAGVDAELLQVRLAELLREAIRKNDQLEACGSAGAARYLSVKAVNNGGSLVAPAAAGTVNVKFGDPTVTLTGSTWVGTIGDGDFLNIAGDTYRIKDVVSTTVLTLDFPFAGTTASALDATDTAEIAYQEIATIQGAGGIGLEITGTDQHEFDVDRHRMYSQSRFNVRFAKDGEGVGTVAVATQASEGVNDWRIVATDVYTSMGNLGQRWNSDIPAAQRTTFSNVTASAAGFGLIDIAIQAERKEMLWNGTLPQRVRLYIETPITGAGTAQLQSVFGTSLT